MLEEKDQIILLELLPDKKLKVRDLQKMIKFDDDNDIFRHLRKLERWNFIHGSAFWSLTYKGSVLARILALLPNNPKNYTKNLKSDIIAFEFIPHG